MRANGRWRTGAGAALLAGLVGAVPETAASDGHVWRTYTNARFGFSICWPSDLVVPEPPPSHERGASFAAADGGHIAVWATEATPRRPLADVAREDEDRLTGRAGTITRRIVRRDYYVLTGRLGDALFYNRTAAKDGTLTSVEITYPVRYKARWDHIVEAIDACLVPG